MKNIQVLFSGKVQGVGFRFITREKAKRLGLEGEVQNLSDRRVKAVFQGPEKSIKKIIEELKENFSIKNIETSEIEKKDFQGFKISL